MSVEFAAGGAFYACKTIPGCLQAWDGMEVALENICKFYWDSQGPEIAIATNGTTYPTVDVYLTARNMIARNIIAGNTIARNTIARNIIARNIIARNMIARNIIARNVIIRTTVIDTKNA